MNIYNTAHTWARSTMKTVLSLKPLDPKAGPEQAKSLAILLDTYDCMPSIKAAAQIVLQIIDVAQVR
jgi:hypothetical protein